MSGFGLLVNFSNVSAQRQKVDIFNRLIIQVNKTLYRIEMKS